MGETVAGAYVEILAEIDSPTLIVGRDLVGDVMHAEGATESDVTHEVIAWRQAMHATEVRGPLTVVRAGQASIRLYDPTRRYDPQAPDGSRIEFGAQIRCLIDGEPVFTGWLDRATYSHMPGIAGWEAGDAIKRSQDTVWRHSGIDAGTTFAQYEQVATTFGYESVGYGAPTAVREFIDGETADVWSVLTDIRRAELGDLWADRHGRLAWRGRHEPGPSSIRALVGAGGIACDGLFVDHDRSKVVNGVVIDMDDGSDRTFLDETSEERDGIRRIRSSESELRLDAPS